MIADAASPTREGALARGPRVASTWSSSAPGLAGLTAAADLDHGRHSVVVLEARDRVGGRTLNHPVGHGEVIEVGGQWVGPGQDRVLARARAHGIKTFKTYTQRRPGARLRRHGQTHFTGLIPPLPEPDATDFGQLLSQDRRAAGRRCRSTSRGRPPTRPRSTRRRWRRSSSANSSTPGARFVFDLATKAVFAAEPRDVSLLHAMFYFHSGNGVINLDQHRRRRAGLALRRRLPARVDPDGAARSAAAWCCTRPCAGSPTTGRGATVQTDAGTLARRGGDRRHGARRWPAGSTTTRRSPPLRDQLTQRVPQGSVIKYEAVYPTPFWRAEGLNGYSNSDRPPVRLTYDNSPPGGKPGRAARLRRAAPTPPAGRLSARRAPPRRARLVHAAVRRARRAPDDADRAQLVRRVRGRAAATPATCRPACGPTTARRCASPSGRIHWAGTETSEVFMGYMDGAVRSGERAAAEVAHGSKARGLRELDVIGLVRPGERARQAELLERGLGNALDARACRTPAPGCAGRWRSRRPRRSAAGLR